MKNFKTYLAAFICLISLAGFSQKAKDYTLQDITPDKKTTCWKVTNGKTVFGENICFNMNSTAQHATGGFGGIRIVKNQLTLKDLNGKSFDSQKTAVYTIKSVSKTKILLVDDKNETIELTFFKK
ncbi:MAG: hypothetical protein ABIP51_11935 [Bacteroidia bacterium]